MIQNNILKNIIETKTGEKIKREKTVFVYISFLSMPQTTNKLVSCFWSNNLFPIQ